MEWEGRHARRGPGAGVGGRMRSDGRVVTGERKTLWRSFLEKINVRFGSVGAGVVLSMPACRTAGVASVGVWRELPCEMAAVRLGCDLISVCSRISGFVERDSQKMFGFQ